MKKNAKKEILEILKIFARVVIIEFVLSVKIVLLLVL